MSLFWKPRAPVPRESDVPGVVGPDPGPDVDPGVLRVLVESAAYVDAASGMYDVHLGEHGHQLIMENEIDRWHHRWSAEAEMRQQRDRAKAALRHRSATRQQATGEQTEDHLAQDLRDAQDYRDRMQRIVEGSEPGDDGGYWPAQDRIDENRRMESLKDWGIYLGAAVAEIGLNYTAFQLMGSSLQETAVLAASIILINVLLPKQLGELVARVRRGRRGRGALLTGLAGGVLLWVGVSLFVAQIRTAYLLLPAASAAQAGQPSLLERAGIGPGTLTVGWLLVVLAVGTVVLIRSATRYNPYLKNLRAARTRVDQLRAALVDAHGAVVAARFDVQRARDTDADLVEVWAAKRAEQDGLAAELKHHYQHHLARKLANPTITDGIEITTGRGARPALPTTQNPGS